jgi:hypothetical protein
MAKLFIINHTSKLEPGSLNFFYVQFVISYLLRKLYFVLR